MGQDWDESIDAEESTQDAVDVDTIATEYVDVDEIGRLELPTEESWGDLDKLEDHYDRHGADFDSMSEDDYARQASEFLQTGQEDGLPTKIDDQGRIRMYDPENNVLGAYNPDGTAITLFSPDPDIHGYNSNQEYWEAQKGREPCELKA